MIDYSFAFSFSVNFRQNTYKQTGRRTGKTKIKQTDRKMNKFREKERQTDRRTDRHGETDVTDKRAYGQDRQTGGHTGQTDRQTDRYDGQTDLKQHSSSNVNLLKSQILWQNADQWLFIYNMSQDFNTSYHVTNPTNGRRGEPEIPSAQNYPTAPRLKFVFSLTDASR